MLISIYSAGKFELGQEAVAALTAVKGPIGICAVCGRARQGKSYILNKVAASHAGEGFVVGPTQRPCTKGIWIWSAPMERTLPDGSTYHMLLIDTEGIDAYGDWPLLILIHISPSHHSSDLRRMVCADQTGQYSTQIFSLAVLLSSLFVYNQMGGIDETALDRLSLVTEMTKHIAVKADSGAEGEAVDLPTPRGRRQLSEIGAFSPSFIWLLRDFYLDLEDEDMNGVTREITPGSYLEMALCNMAGEGEAIESKNSIRESIRGLFPERECCALVRPMMDEKKLRKLNEVPMEELRPEFTEGLGELITMINQRCRPKRVGDDVLNGPALASLAAAYVGAINDGAVPAIATAWQNVAEAECRRVSEDAEGVYVKQFAHLAADCPPDEAQLNTAHAHALKRAIEAFNSQAVGGKPVRELHIQMIEEKATRRFEEFKTAKYAEAASHANALVGEILDELTKSSEHSETPVLHCLDGLEAGVDKFVNEAAGPEKCALLAGLAKRAVGGPLKAAHAAEVSTAEATKEKLRAEGAEAVAAVELQLEQAKTAAANESTSAAKRESELKESAAAELAAAQKDAHEAQQEAASALAQAQQAAHDASTAAAAELAAADLKHQQAVADGEKALAEADRQMLSDQAESARELGAADERLRTETAAKEDTDRKLDKKKKELIEVKAESKKSISDLDDQLKASNTQRQREADEQKEREIRMLAVAEAKEEELSFQLGDMEKKYQKFRTGAQKKIDQAEEDLTTALLHNEAHIQLIYELNHQKGKDLVRVGYSPPKSGFRAKIKGFFSSDDKDKEDDDGAEGENE